MNGEVRREESDPGATSSRTIPRVLGRHGTRGDSPLIVCVAGLHGNEPAGVFALQRVFASLARHRPVFRGRLVGLAGNLTALRLGRRYVDRDLNRCWGPEDVAEIRLSRGTAGEGRVEDREQRALIDELEAELDACPAEVFVLDLHTTSAPSAPFLTLGDSLRNRAFARKIPLPLVLGIEERIDGSLLEFINGHGPVTLGIEAGQHDDPSSVEHHEWALWLALVAAGAIDRAVVPNEAAMRRALEAAVGSVPPVFEVRYRKAVSRGDSFVMRPGFRNFQPVRAGDIMAADARGVIAAPEAGRVFLPLYQEQGSDGYFLVRPIRPFWLLASALLRGVRADAAVHWLPGVRRSASDPATLIVDRRVARWRVADIFHLLGFRKVREAGLQVTFSRRSHPAGRPCAGPPGGRRDPTDRCTGEAIPGARSPGAPRGSGVA